MRILFLAVVVCLAQQVMAEDYDAMKQRIEVQQKTPDRHEFDHRRDAARKPLELFQFLGLEAGMTVMDVGAFAGYTSEMMAAAVGLEGKVYMHNLEKVYLRFADGYYRKAVDERLANNRLPNTVNYLSEYEDLGLVEELDLAFWGNNFHDYYYHDEGELDSLGILKSVYKTLKPGGIFGIMDHIGKADGNNSRLHRIDPDIIREQLIEAGFVIEAETDLYSNPEDDHSLMVYDDEVYLKTDRVMIKAIKPG